jgi:molybdopterin-guanine dinucleotide biosynthesis protein A
VVGFAAVVLAGGAARRMGGADKPALPVGGQSMLSRVLAAVGDAEPRVVVGPVPPDLPVPVRGTRESPPGGGPVAAAAAGLTLVPRDVALVALLAADLPLLTGEAVDVLRLTVEGGPMDGAVYRDADGRRQLLCGVWRAASLRRALDRCSAARGGLTGASVQALVDDLRVAEVSWRRPGPPPWFDCDTDDDLRAAEEWTGGRTR